VIKDINEIPPTVFVKSVMYATHKAYGSKRTEIKKTKSMKLVLKTAEKCGYNRLSHGFYMFGDYSFQVYSIFSRIFNGPSLHGMKQDADIDMELVDYVTPTVTELSKIFLRRFSNFMKWAHVQEIPKDYLDFYHYADDFRDFLRDDLYHSRKNEISKYYAITSEKISNLDGCLNHVPKEQLDVYFKFTDLLEGSLLVCKVRKVNYNLFKDILKDMIDTYDRDVSSVLYPYLETLHGGNNEYETEEYNANLIRKMEIITTKLDEINIELSKFDFKPTLEEMDSEIIIELNKLDTTEKQELFSELKS
jgi:hypothetical protein